MIPDMEQRHRELTARNELVHFVVDVGDLGIHSLRDNRLGVGIEVSVPTDALLVRGGSFFNVDDAASPTTPAGGFPESCSDQPHSTRRPIRHSPRRSTSMWGPWIR